MPLNYAQLEHSRGEFAAQYATWQAEMNSRAGILKELFSEAATNPDLLRQAIEKRTTTHQPLPGKTDREPIQTHKPLPQPPGSYT